MSGQAETLRQQLARARKKMEALRQENERLSTHNQEKKRVDDHKPDESMENKRMDTMTKATIWLAILTFFSIVAISVGTWLTISTDEENKFLPILVLGTQDDNTDKDNVAHTIVIRNIGFGP